MFIALKLSLRRAVEQYVSLFIRIQAGRNKNVKRLFSYEKILMKIYLDNCCINRPLDDKSQLRIAIESEIVLNILSLVESEEIRLISSELLEFEANKNTNIFRREFT